MCIRNIDTNHTVDIIRRDIDVVIVKDNITHIVEVNGVVLTYNLRFCDVKYCIALHEDTVVISVECRVCAMETVLPGGGQNAFIFIQAESTKLLVIICAGIDQ